MRGIFHFYFYFYSNLYIGICTEIVKQLCYINHYSWHADKLSVSKQSSSEDNHGLWSSAVTCAPNNFPSRYCQSRPGSSPWSCRGSRLKLFIFMDPGRSLFSSQPNYPCHARPSQLISNGCSLWIIWPCLLDHYLQMPPWTRVTTWWTRKGGAHALPFQSSGITGQRNPSSSHLERRRRKTRLPKLNQRKGSGSTPSPFWSWGE